MPTIGLAVAVALAGILSAVPVFAQDAEKQVEAGSTSALFAVVGLAMDDELNIRATATPTSVVIARVPNGTALKNRGCMIVDKYVWCKVEYPDDATVVGWSPARYLIELPGSGIAEDLPATAIRNADAAPAGGEDTADKKAVAEATEGIMGSKVFGPLDDRSEADDRKAPVAAVQAVAEGAETDGDPVAAPPGTIQLPVTLGEDLAKIEPNAAVSIAPPPPAPPVAVAETEVAAKEAAAVPGGQDVVPASNGGGAPPAAAGPASAAAVVEGAGAPMPETVKALASPVAAGDDANMPAVEAEAPKPAPAEPEPASAGDGEKAKADSESGAPVASSSQGATEPQASVTGAYPGPAATAEAKPVSADTVEVTDASLKAQDLASKDGGVAAPEGGAADGTEAAYADEETDLASGKSGLELLRARFGKLEQIEEAGSGDGAAAAGEDAKLTSETSGNADLASSESEAGSVPAAEAGKARTDATEVAVDVRDHDDVKTASGGFDETGEISCSRYFGQPMIRCRAGVLRGEKGEALVTVTWPDGGERVIRFRAGQVEGTDASDAVTVVREAELNLIRVGKGERFEIPDGFAFGG